MSNAPDTNTDTEYAEALARALGYTTEAGLSDGTDRPATLTELLGYHWSPSSPYYGGLS